MYDKTNAGTIIIALVIVFFLVRFFLANRKPSPEYLQEVDQTIARLTPEALEKVQVAYRANRKIEAIKYFRADTNAGLKVAKDSVAKMMQAEGL